MITREQYLNALELIDQYHQQFKDPKPKAMHDLKVGDVVVFDKVMTKSLTTGKMYTVEFVEPGFFFEIKDDEGKIRGLRKNAKGYKMRIV